MSNLSPRSDRPSAASVRSASRIGTIALSLAGMVGPTGMVSTIGMLGTVVVPARTALADEYAVNAPRPSYPIPAPESEGGGCEGATLFKNHDDSFEGAYSWTFGGVQAPHYGAFAEGFDGTFDLCEARFTFAQVGNQAGQSMDVYVWSDNGTDDPGAVIALVPDVDPGTVATWPAVSAHSVPLDVLVSGNWWVGYWGDWPGANAGWFVAADENGPGGNPRTEIAPGIGYASGWYHPGIVFGWENAKSLGIEASADTPSSVEVDPLVDSEIISRVQPNPSWHDTEISLRLSASGPLRVDVFDARGRNVRILREGSFEAGVHVVRWDGTGEDGVTVSAGTYFIHARDRNGTDIEKVVRLR